VTSAMSAVAVPGQLHPLSLIRMVWKHKLLVVLVTLVVSAVAVVLIYRLPAVYRAEAVVLVDSQKIPEKFVVSTVQDNLQDSLNAISQQVLASGQLQTIIDDLGLYKAERRTKTPEEVLSKMKNDDLNITLERGLGGGRSGAFRITFEGHDPQVVAAVVNRIADLFKQANSQNREQRAEGTTGFLSDELQQSKEMLDKQEAALSAFKLHYNGELPQQEAALLGQLAQLRAEFNANEEGINRDTSGRIVLKSNLQSAQSSLEAALRLVSASRPRPQPAVRGEAPRVVTVAPTRGPRPSDSIRAQLDQASQRYGEAHPEITRLKAALKRALDEEAKNDAAVAQDQPPATADPAPIAANLPPEIPDFVDPGPLPTAAEINRDRQQVNDLTTNIDVLDKDIAKRNADSQRITGEIKGIQSRVDNLPVREQQMLALMRDYDTWKTNYRQLLEHKQSAEMAQAMERGEQSERFIVADPAHVPTAPVKPRRMIYSIAAGLFALALGLGTALLLEFRKNVFLGEWELVGNIPVLGRISRITPPGATSGGGYAGSLAMLAIVGIVGAAKAAYPLLAGVLAGVLGGRT
jgi:succinoglycan biosynthesis transport protein ExoP